MIEIEVPLEHGSDAELEPERMLGGGGSVASRVSLAMGSSARIARGSIADLPAEADRLMEKADFHVVSFVCTLLEKEGETIQRAEFAVTLTSDQGSPSTWSMTPQKVYPDQPRQPPRLSFEAGLSANLIISPSLKFAADFTPDVPVEPWLRGVGEGQADPEWVLKRIGKSSLSDDHVLSLVVQTSKGARLTVSSTLDAWVARPGLDTFLARARKKSADGQASYDFEFTK